MRSLFMGLCLVVLAAGLYAADIVPPHASEKPIPVAEIYSHGIEGRLGVKLGTIVAVTGEVIPNRRREKRYDSVPFFLRIDAVNGQRLLMPVEYPFVVARPSGTADEPKIGDRFRYVGYETGEYQGSPQREFDFVKPYASTAFAFETQFLVLVARPPLPAQK